MITILNLHLSHLTNDTHFNFFNEYITLTDRFPAIKQKLKPEIDRIKALHLDEDTALKKILKSVYTAEVEAKDRYRGEIWRGFVDTVKGALLHYDYELRENAEHLKILIDTYGNVAKKTLDEETSAVYNIVEDLKGKFKDDVKYLALEGWVSELEVANKQFQWAMRDRYDEMAAQTHLKLTEVRPLVDEAYHGFIKKLDAMITLEGETPYYEFVVTLNTVIKRYNDILAQQKGRAAAKSANKDEHGDEGNKPEGGNDGHGDEGKEPEDGRDGHGEARKTEPQGPKASE